MSASHPRTTVGSVYRNASLLALVILWVALFATRPARAQGAGSSKFQVDSQRLQGTLQKLSEFLMGKGRPQTGQGTQRYRGVL